MALLLEQIPETQRMGQYATKTQQVEPKALAEDRFPRGAEILIEALVHEGVDSIFGYPGGAVLHMKLRAGGELRLGVYLTVRLNSRQVGKQRRMRFRFQFRRLGYIKSNKCRKAAS